MQRLPHQLVIRASESATPDARNPSRMRVSHGLSSYRERDSKLKSQPKRHENARLSACVQLGDRKQPEHSERREISTFELRARGCGVSIPRYSVSLRYLRRCGLIPGPLQVAAVACRSCAGAPDVDARQHAGPKNDVDRAAALFLASKRDTAEGRCRQPTFPHSQVPLSRTANCSLPPGLHG